ncbi:discoidin domain-containing protein [Paenibacillus campi]|uniref:discoidin domain-containing protein n=1 Tax=Paenibacillus campi TaxID=3106031 RepID=UPI002AFE7EC6|nr:discoidin domain-containing protein [Paenibacillus sp. SGZ-1009]
MMINQSVTTSLLFVMVIVLLVGSVMPSQAKAATNDAVQNMIFAIPANTFCDQSHLVELSLNITNLSNTEQTIKLELLKADGSAVTNAGTAYNGIKSDLMPGFNVKVAARHTGTYHFTFGGQSSNCDDRPFAGVWTTAGAVEAQLIASGFVSSSLYSVPVIVNGGMVWNMAAQSDTETSPTPAPTPVPINQPVDSCSVTPTDSLIHAMSANQDVYGIASSSSYDTAWNTQPFRAFDNRCAPFSTQNGDIKGWLAYEFKQAKTVTSYSLQMKQGDSQYGFAQSPKAWVFEAYDGKAWKTLDTRSGITNWTTSKANVYTIDNITAYNKYRIRFLENNGGNLVCISEMGMMGY